jgi:pimeloyl-ACP methyl ester carboxylesterase
VVLIHGSASDLRVWQPLYSALTLNHRIIAYSRRHHWPSPPPHDEYSFGDDVDDLTEILSALSISSAHLIAHSAGGLVALEFAKRHGEKARSLSLFDPNASGILSPSEAAIVDSERGPWLESVRKSLSAGDDKAALRHLFKPLVRTKRLPRWIGAMANDNLFALRRQFASPLAPPSVSCDELRRYPKSILVLQGENSPRAFLIMNGALQRCARDAQLETIDDCGHIFQVDAPERVGKRITQFLRDQAR